jgi:YVTN family beta-propeller protein
VAALAPATALGRGDETGTHATTGTIPPSYPASSLREGWIGGPPPEGGATTGPYATVGAPTRPDAAPPGADTPAEPHHDPRYEAYDPRYGTPPPEQFAGPGNGHGGWPPAPPADHGGGDYGAPAPQAGPPQHGGPRPPATGAAPRRRRGAVVAAAVAVLVLLAGGITYVLLRPAAAPTVAAGSSPSPILLPPPAPRPTEQKLAVAASRPIPAVRGELPVGKTPGFVAINPDGTFAYVANRGAGVVTVVDTAIDKVVATIPIPDGPPQYLAFSPDGTRLYVSVFNDPDRSINEVAVLDTQTNTVLTTI